MRLPIESRLTVRQVAEARKNPPPPLQPERPSKGAKLDEKCAWMKARQAAKEAAAILKETRHG